MRIWKGADHMYDIEKYYQASDVQDAVRALEADRTLL